MESTPKNKMIEDVETLKMNTNEATKSNKCNQCNYASSYAHHLKTHLKMHSGDKSNKCNQCDYTSSQTGHLRTHLIAHSGEKSIDAASVTMHPLEQATLGTT